MVVRVKAVPRTKCSGSFAWCSTARSAPKFSAVESPPLERAANGDHEGHQEHGRVAVGELRAASAR